MPTGGPFHPRFDETRFKLFVNGQSNSTCFGAFQPSKNIRSVITQENVLR